MIGYKKERENRMSKLIFIVVNPDNWTEFTVFETSGSAIAFLENDGYSLHGGRREMKASPRARSFFYKGNDVRLVYCREVMQ